MSDQSAGREGQRQDPAAEREPTSGDEPSRVDQLDDPPAGGGPAVTPTGTSPGAADTSVFEPGEEPDEQERLQSADEDTFPPSG